MSEQEHSTIEQQEESDFLIPEMSLEEGGTQRDRFRLSISNLIFMGIFSAFGVFIISLGELTPFTIGLLIGELLRYFLMTTFITWILWLIVGRRKRVRSIAFNVILTLQILAPMVIAGVNGYQERSQYNRELAAAKTPAEIKKIQERYEQRKGKLIKEKN